MSGLSINDDSIGDLASGEDDLSVRAVGIYREDATATRFEKKSAADRGFAAGCKT
jgi:hypothetical protein